LGYDGGDRRILRQWINVVQAHCDNIHRQMVTLQDTTLHSSNFRNRQQVQQDKMRGIKAETLWIDWAQKLAPKIKVYSGRAKPFSPFKSSVIIQNEDAATTFWKCYPGSESFHTIKLDLRKLRRRFDINGSVMKITHVDNCCSVRLVLKEVFGQWALVKLDAFHWCERWNKLLDDPKSDNAAIFRGALRKALHVVEPGEHQQVKFLLSCKPKFQKLK